MTIIQWKQHHAFGMIIEMLNDKKKTYWIIMQHSNWTHLCLVMYMQPDIYATRYMLYVGLKAN
jgi:hypothetical protein